MPHILQNNDLSVTIDLPHEGYQYSRFDWSGKVTKLSFRGIPITTTELNDHFEKKRYGRGLYNEFDIDGPDRYNRTTAGDPFHKIGIGQLLKTRPRYDFNLPYSIEPAQFDYELLPDQISIRCKSSIIDRTSHTLHKTIKLKGQELVIEYELHNTGDTFISTTEYVHNFIAVNHGAIGKDYELRFPFDIDLGKCSEIVNLDNAVMINKNTVVFKHHPTQPFFFSELSSGQTAPAQWHLYHKPSQLHITETGDFSAHKVNLWGDSHVISPELFHRVDIAPGAQSHWTRTYRFWMSENEM